MTITKNRKILALYSKFMMLVGIFGQFLFYSQTFKIVYHKSADGVSLLGFSVALFSVASWLIYGLVIKNKVLIISNIIATVGALMVIISILIYR